MLKGSSRFGAELDSLADFVDFGVAPAMLLYVWRLDELSSFGWICALVLAKHPGLSPFELKSLLYLTAANVEAGVA